MVCNSSHDLNYGLFNLLFRWGSEWKTKKSPPFENRTKLQSIFGPLAIRTCSIFKPLLYSFIIQIRPILRSQCEVAMRFPTHQIVGDNRCRSSGTERHFPIVSHSRRLLLDGLNDVQTDLTLKVGQFRTTEQDPYHVLFQVRLLKKIWELSKGTFIDRVPYFSYLTRTPFSLCSGVTLPVTQFSPLWNITFSLTQSFIFLLQFLENIVLQIPRHLW